MKKLLLATVALVTLVIPKISQASPIIFTASDPSAVPGGSFPNSLAEAALFASAASGVQTTVTFESSSVGAFTNLTIAPGVTINGSDFQMNPQQILSAPLCGSVCGFNTTPSGANYVSLQAGTLTFSFTQSIDAFGAYLTGVQLDGETVQFNDGSPQSLTLPNPGSSGGVMFYGFTDNGNKINSITFNLTAAIFDDFIGIDDVTFASGAVSAAPLPAALPLFATGLGGLGLLGWRRKRKAQAGA